MHSHELKSTWDDNKKWWADARKYRFYALFPKNNLQRLTLCLLNTCTNTICVFFSTAVGWFVEQKARKDLHQVNATFNGCLMIHQNCFIVEMMNWRVQTDDPNNWVRKSEESLKKIFIARIRRKTQPQVLRAAALLHNRSHRIATRPSLAVIFIILITYVKYQNAARLFSQQSHKGDCIITDWTFRISCSQHCFKLFPGHRICGCPAFFLPVSKWIILEQKNALHNFSHIMTQNYSPNMNNPSTEIRQQKTPSQSHNNSLWIKPAWFLVECHENDWGRCGNTKAANSLNQNHS